MVTRIVTPEAASQAARAVRRSAQRTAAGVLGLAGERMSRVDTAWLRMDSSANLMMIVGVWVLRPGVDHGQLLQRVADRLLRYPRFRQRVVEDAAGASWVEDRRMDIADHVQPSRLQRRRGQTPQQALQERVAQVAATPLDRRRPLWHIEHIQDYDGGSALVVRIHHCIADGIALISVMMTLVDGGAEPPSRQRPEPPDSAEAWIAQTLIRPLTDVAVRALDAAGEGAARGLHLLREPGRGVAGSMDIARLAYQVLSDAAALALMPDDAATSLKGTPSGQKRVAWCEPLPLDEVKAVGRALDCSVNDVLLSCVAGAIGEYLTARGEAVEGLELRAMIPVNLRPLEEAWKLGNRFGLVPLLLPIGIANPVERVYEVRRRMRALKGSTQPLLAFGLLSVAGLLVKPAQEALLNLFARKTTAVMTNVPGPREKLRFCGSTLEETLFWVPQSGDIGLGVSILSYGGGVQFGVVSDAALCPQPQEIIDAFEPQFSRLLLLTLMLPWDDEASGFGSDRA